MGDAVFFDEHSGLCTIHTFKPIICLVTYCGLVAVKNGVLYYKHSIVDGKPVYRLWRGSIELLKHLVQREARRMRRWQGYGWKRKHVH